MASYREIREEVERVIGRDMFDELVDYVKAHPPALWGEEQPRAFLSTMVCTTLYKDLFGVGYVDLMSETEVPFHISHRSIWHNVPSIRLVLEQWGDAQWETGSLPEWREAARRLNIPPAFAVRPSLKFTLFGAFRGSEFTRFFATLLCCRKSVGDHH